MPWADGVYKTRGLWLYYGNASATTASNVVVQSNSTNTMTTWNENVQYNQAGMIQQRMGQQASPPFLELPEIEERNREATSRLVAARAAHAADDTADKLLRAHLDAEQLAEFRRSRSFVVTVGGDRPIFGRPAQQRRYRLRWGWARNIDVLDANGRRTGVLCIHPTTPVPYADNLLAQKLMIEADEQQFLRIANRSEAA